MKEGDVVKEFIRKLFSLEEEKASIVIWMFVLTHILGLWKAFKIGDYPDNMMILDQFYVGVIIGYAGVKLFQPKGKLPVELPPTKAITEEVKGDNIATVSSEETPNYGNSEGGGK